MQRIGKLELALLCIVLFSAFFIFGHHIAASSQSQKAQVATAIDQDTAAAMTSPFASVSLQAKAAYVYDVKENKVLFEQDATEVLPLASLTKLMTALTATELYPASTVVTIGRDDLGQDGDNGLLLGEKWSLKDLLDFTLIVSSNDGAHAIAAAYTDGATTTPFIADMNSTAQKLGLTSLEYYNATGLDLDDTTSGGYGSAQDVAKLFGYILANDPDLLEVTAYPTFAVTSLSGDKHVGQNTDDLVNKIPELIASKTGYTDLAGGNLVIAYDAGIDHPIIVAVLGSTYDSRFTDVDQLVKASLAYITATNTPAQ